VLILLAASGRNVKSKITRMAHPKSEVWRPKENVGIVKTEKRPAFILANYTSNITSATAASKYSTVAENAACNSVVEFGAGRSKHNV
jgi:hypothetical protein